MKSIDYNLDRGLKLELLEDIKKNIKMLECQNKLNNKKVFLFGFHTLTYFIIDYLEEIKVHVSGIIDNNEKYIGTKYKSYKVNLPEKILLPFNEDVCVIIASSYYREMCKQLKDMGYIEGKNIIQVVNFKKLIEEVAKTDLLPVSEKEQKSLQLELLQKVHNLCQKKNLYYCIFAGTLLGAVRHKGFIPWDDDIDVLMPMDDLLELEKELSNDNSVSLLSPFHTEGYFGRCYKLMDNRTTGFGIHFPLKVSWGVDIDIFPLVGYPENVNILEYGEMVKRLQQEKNALFYKDGITMTELKDKQQQFMECATKYSWENTKKAGAMLSSRYFTKVVMDKEVYLNRVLLEFEGRTFYAPGRYEDYLKLTYGDYMQLPPKEKRVAVHPMKFYWNNINEEENHAKK